MVLALKSHGVPELVQVVHGIVQVILGSQRLGLYNSPVYVLPVIVWAKGLNEPLFDGRRNISIESLILLLPADDPFVKFLIVGKLDSVQVLAHEHTCVA